MIALVVAGTSHTLVTRLPGLEGSGTRVHTMPDALATSTAATHPTTCSYSSSWISCGSRIAGPSPPSWPATRDARGPRSEAESLTGVLEAQCATRQGQGPSARLTYGLTAQRSAGVGGQPGPIFTPARRPRRDTRTNPKINGEQAGGSTRRSAAQPGPSGVDRCAGQAAGWRVTL